jgi:hypothetical protein
MEGADRIRLSQNRENRGSANSVLKPLFPKNAGISSASEHCIPCNVGLCYAKLLN